MKIHGSPTIGNPRRVAIFLAEKGLEIPFVPVDLYSHEHRGAAFLEKNPIGLVPVLELDDGTFISETMTICRYLEELHPEPSILGRDPLDRAIRDMWQRRIEFGFYMAIRAYYRHCFEPARVLEPVQVAEWGELNRDIAERDLRVLDPQLAENEFVAGPDFSAADITLVMSLQGTSATGFRIPEDCPNVERWYSEVVLRPSVVATEPRRGNPARG
jgi:glutathione S-transferase